MGHDYSTTEVDVKRELDRNFGAAAGTAAVGAALGVSVRGPSGRPPAPSSAPRDRSTLTECVAFLDNLISRARDINSTIEDHADLIAGHEPPKAGTNSVAGPVEDGVTSALVGRLTTLDAILNEMVHHNGRLGRALS